MVSDTADNSSDLSWLRSAYSLSTLAQVFARLAKKFLSASTSEVVFSRSSLSSTSFLLVAASSSVVSEIVSSPAWISASLEVRRSWKLEAASDSFSWAVWRSPVICSSRVFMMPKISPDWLLYSGCCWKKAVTLAVVSASSLWATARSSACSSSVESPGVTGGTARKLAPCPAWPWLLNLKASFFSSVLVFSGPVLDFSSTITAAFRASTFMMASFS
mmetsp:Transcript_46497/g.99656  ORF Transcript_46497/g.99656 Transcript_46497/m.99656 type:complete len:217 (+) Transcript_46497:1144-1794(+)